MLDSHNTSVLSKPLGHFGGVDEHIVLLFSWIVYSVVCQAIDIFGIATNIVNIIVFVKQGFNDYVNISLLSKYTCPQPLVQYKL